MWNKAQCFYIFDPSPLRNLVSVRKNEDHPWERGCLWTNNISSFKWGLRLLNLTPQFQCRKSFVEQRCFQEFTLIYLKTEYKVAAYSGLSQTYFDHMGGPHGSFSLLTVNRRPTYTTHILLFLAVDNAKECDVRQTANCVFPENGKGSCTVQHLLKQTHIIKCPVCLYFH